MSLPLDLLPNILRSLDNSDLKICILVSNSFRHIALPLFLAHVTLCSQTWKKKCAFLLGEAGITLRSNIRKITVKIDEIPILSRDSEFPSLLRLVLREIGPRLDALCIRSKDERSWNELHPAFLKVVVASMPQIRSLELPGICNIPLLTALSPFPLLQRLYLKSEHFIITIRDYNFDIDALPSLPKVTFLSVDSFVQEDFSRYNSLGRYILAAGSEIQSIDLVQFCDDEFPLNWDFLEPYTGSLLHLSLGTHLYETVVKRLFGRDILEDDIVNFHILPKLQSITFYIPTNASPQDWRLWSSWITRNMENITDNPLPSLEKLIFILKSGIAPDADSSTTLDDLAVRSSFEIHMIISCPAASFSRSATAVRSCLPSWDVTGRLKCWIRI
ncbi:hypothetical protein DL96DRAFT_1581067 [Flagelloscypha sp. PMI_526]|nr:hypothetical protein DL96DRAFT_1581067 [Flagelloscypha sp. PMI_526]